MEDGGWKMEDGKGGWMICEITKNPEVMKMFIEWIE